MSDYYRLETELYDKEKIEYLLDTLPGFVTSYIKSISQTTTPKTRLSYLRDINQFLTYVKDADPSISSAKKITPECLEHLSLDFFNTYLDFLTTYEENGKIRTNSRVSIRRKLSSLRNLYNFLIISELIEINPITRVKIPDVKKDKNIIRLETDECENFLDTVEYGKGNLSPQMQKYFDKYAPRDTAIIYTLLRTGIRVSELVGLDIPDINIEKKSLTVVRKGGKKDIIYYGDELADILGDYLVYRKGIYTDEEYEDALFLSAQRRRITVRSVENLVKKYVNRAGIEKHITPHKLRTTYGTALYEATGDLYLVADALGHSSVTTTQKAYTEVSSERKKKYRNALDEYYGEEPGEK